MLDENFWNQRYLDGITGWDLGEVSTPIKTYFDQVRKKSAKILIPGAGNAHEAEYLHHQGFKNVHVIDIATEPLESLKQRIPDFPSDHIHHEDFFKITGQFDFIIEQTFFCALDPSLREDYVLKMKELLKPDGILVGVMFNREFEGGPPFGGDLYEYFDLFNPHFKLIKIEPCYNSVHPRKGTEVFIQVSGKIA